MNDSKIYFHNSIECQSCKKKFDSSYFPYIVQRICLYCYEQKHNKTLHKLRYLLALPEKKSIKQQEKPYCPRCNSNLTRKAKFKKMVHSEYFCKSCFLIWNISIDKKD